MRLDSLKKQYQSRNDTFYKLMEIKKNLENSVIKIISEIIYLFHFFFLNLRSRLFRLRINLKITHRTLSFMNMIRNQSQIPMSMGNILILQNIMIILPCLTNTLCLTRQTRLNAPFP